LAFTLAYAKLFEQARKDNVLVLLDGQGMDEGGIYDYYPGENDDNHSRGYGFTFKEYAFRFFFG
jgi:hypothetical protein